MSVLCAATLSAFAGACIDDTSCVDTATCPRETEDASLDRAGNETGSEGSNQDAFVPGLVDTRDDFRSDLGSVRDGAAMSDATIDRSITDGGTDVPSIDGSSRPEADATGPSSDAALDTGDERDARADMTPDSSTCTNECTLNAMQCLAGTVQTCKSQPNGCAGWVTTTTCGSHQTCVAGGAGAATCQCKPSVCTQIGKQCDSQSTLNTCATDGQCFYVESSATCTAPMTCAGQAPNAACSLTCTDSCTKGQSACTSSGVQTCSLQSNGCYAYTLTTTCVGAQSCTVTGGVATCNCNNDAACSSTTGNTCTATTNSSSYVTCTKDAGGCFKQTGSTGCPNGACTGTAGTASCCLNQCVTGIVQCGSTTTLDTCQKQSTGCTAWTAQKCSAGEVCERHGGVSCVDPNWAEWPMPNTAPDVPNAPNPASYSDGGDGTVADNLTALIWQIGSSNSSSWQDGAAYCAGLGLAGHADWRLPTLIELISILDYGTVGPTANATYFPEKTEFWSSTMVAGSSSDAIKVNFNTGQTAFAPTATLLSIRCVR